MLQNPIIGIWIFMSKDKLIDIVVFLLISISRYLRSFTVFIFILATQVVPWAHSGSPVLHPCPFHCTYCTYDSSWIPEYASELQVVPSFYNLHAPQHRLNAYTVERYIASLPLCRMPPNQAPCCSRRYTCRDGEGAREWEMHILPPSNYWILDLQVISCGHPNPM